jgi:hypothetical protein
MDKLIYAALGEDEETGDDYMFRFLTKEEADQFCTEAAKLDPRISWSYVAIMITDVDDAIEELRFCLEAHP